MYQSLADMACNRITAAITSKQGERSIKALLDSYNPTGSTRHVKLHDFQRPASGRPIPGSAT